MKKTDRKIRKNLRTDAPCVPEGFTETFRRTLDEIKTSRAENGDGFIKAMWCGEEECEDRVKELTGVGSRCIPFDQEHISDTCVCCGKPAKHMVLWAKAY